MALHILRFGKFSRNSTTTLNFLFAVRLFAAAKNEPRRRRKATG